MVDISSAYGSFFQHRRCFPLSIPYPLTIFLWLWILVFGSLFMWQRSSINGGRLFGRAAPLGRLVPRLRPVVLNLLDFGAVGDGRTLNTEAFESAVAAISRLAGKGGGQLNVPAGRWLTAPFNLTSHITLFLAEGAIILGIQDESYWPLMPPLPSYGYGREHIGPRYGSLIHGQHLTDVVITGYNGSIDGQGQFWWAKHQKKLLNHTRGPLLEIMWSSGLVISNITLRDSPFWTIHPYDCSNVTLSGLTILAPLSGAPNTDGIDPDSCSDVLIEHCYIRVGDDGIAIKSGWDQYGAAYARPSVRICIHNVTVQSLVSAGVSIGSEMSGGVSNITLQDVHVLDSRRGFRIKTAPGRGGYVRSIACRNLTLDRVRVGIVVDTEYDEHPPGPRPDPLAAPTIDDLSFDGVRGHAVRVPVRIRGTELIPIRGLVFRDMSVGTTYKKKHVFQCSYVEGRAVGPIYPEPCDGLDRYDAAGQLLKRSANRTTADVSHDF